MCSKRERMANTTCTFNLLNKQVNQKVKTSMMIADNIKLLRKKATLSENSITLNSKLVTNWLKAERR